MINIFNVIRKWLSIDKFFLKSIIANAIVIMQCKCCLFNVFVLQSDSIDIWQMFEAMFFMLSNIKKDSNDNNTHQTVAGRGVKSFLKLFNDTMNNFQTDGNITQIIDEVNDVNEKATLGKRWNILTGISKIFEMCHINGSRMSNLATLSGDIRSAIKKFNPNEANPAVVTIQNTSIATITTKIQEEIAISIQQIQQLLQNNEFKKQLSKQWSDTLKNLCVNWKNKIEIVENKKIIDELQLLLSHLSMVNPLPLLLGISKNTVQAKITEHSAILKPFEKEIMSWCEGMIFLRSTPNERTLVKVDVSFVEWFVLKFLNKIENDLFKKNSTANGKQSQYTSALPSGKGMTWLSAVGYQFNTKLTRVTILFCILCIFFCYSPKSSSKIANINTKDANCGTTTSQILLKIFNKMKFKTVGLYNKIEENTINQYIKQFFSSNDMKRCWIDWNFLVIIGLKLHVKKECWEFGNSSEISEVAESLTSKFNVIMNDNNGNDIENENEDEDGDEDEDEDIDIENENEDEDEDEDIDIETSQQNKTKQGWFTNLKIIQDSARQLKSVANQEAKRRGHAFVCQDTESSKMKKNVKNILSKYVSFGDEFGTGINYIETLVIGENNTVSTTIRENNILKHINNTLPQTPDSVNEQKQQQELTEQTQFRAFGNNINNGVHLNSEISKNWPELWEKEENQLSKMKLLLRKGYEMINKMDSKALLDCTNNNVFPYAFALSELGIGPQEEYLLESVAVSTVKVSVMYQILIFCEYLFLLLIFLSLTD